MILTVATISRGRRRRQRRVVTAVHEMMRWSFAIHDQDARGRGQDIAATCKGGGEHYVGAGERLGYPCRGGVLTDVVLVEARHGHRRAAGI
jgi:hypothetical protein